MAEVRAIPGRRSRVSLRAILLVSIAGLPLLHAQSPPAPSQSPSPPAFSQLSAQATSAREQGDSVRAIALYEQALQANPSWNEGWWYLGQLHYAANNYGQAEDAFTHYLALLPNAAPATALRGLCEFELGQYEASLSDIQHALSLGAADDARNAQILRYHEGLLLTRLGRFEPALDAYRYFARQHLANPDLLVAVGLATLRLPLLPQEATAAQMQMSALAGKAAFSLLAQQPDAAAQAFTAFLQRYPDTPNVHYTWGYLLYPTDQDAAIAQFRQELSIDPKNAVDRTMLAWAYLMEDDPSEALPQARQAAKEAPQLPLAQLSLGRALLETGDVQSATSILEAALAHDPNNLEIHIALARAYSESGREDDARRERLACLRMTEPTSKPAPAMGQQGVSPAG